jgi:hypothetical protein
MIWCRWSRWGERMLISGRERAIGNIHAKPSVSADLPDIDAIIRISMALGTM